MYLMLNGVRYHVEVEGKGPALLLLHGFTGAASNWQPFVPLWSTCYQVIRVDLIGHGQTDAPQESSRYAMEQVAADMVELLDQLKIDQVHLLGYSMGGRLALSFSLWYPQRVHSLVLESSSPGLAEPEARKQRVASDQKLADWIEREGVEAFVSRWESIPLFSSQQSLPEEVRLQIRKQRLQNRAQGLAASLRGMGTGVQPSGWERLRELSIPSLLIVGEWDSKFREIAGRMARQMPLSETVVIPEAGHTVHVEQPERFGTIVLDFIKKRDRLKGSPGR